ncbi:MAG: hypothetical protein Q7R71_01045 [bacterium]|nr:hypothetical protein [bacterium]
MKKFLWTYETVKFCVYWGCWVAALLLLAALATMSPKAALGLLKTVEPLSGLVKDIFWAFVPQEGQLIRAAGKFFGWLGRRAARLTSDRTQVVIQLGILNGLLLVTIVAHIAKWLIMYHIRRTMVRKLFERYCITENTVKEDISGGQQEPRFD